MSSQPTCETCEFGRDGRCYWPTYADSDVDVWDASVDPLPPWLERHIDGLVGERVSARDCSACPCFEQREAKVESERCTETPDMFKP